MEKIVLQLNDDDFATAAQIAEFGNFDSVEDYLNRVDLQTHETDTIKPPLD